MIDKRLYQETFSHLRASDQAKQEVFQKMQEMNWRPGPVDCVPGQRGRHQL